MSNGRSRFRVLAALFVFGFGSEFQSSDFGVPFRPMSNVELRTVKI